MSNLFSSFDSLVYFNSVNFRFNWFAIIIILFLYPQAYWLVSSNYVLILNQVIKFLSVEVKAIFRNTVLQGTIFIFIYIFFFVIFTNVLGLFPYVFTRSSHIVFTIMLAFPIWVGTIIYSVIFQYMKILTHLLPTGTPNILIPVIVIIETIRNIIRPGTLSIRLAANMIAGHLLLSLLGSNLVISGPLNLIILLVIIIMLLILELAVACIQSYVFIVLRSLYLNELNSLSFTKGFLN